MSDIKIPQPLNDKELKEIAEVLNYLVSRKKLILEEYLPASPSHYCEAQEISYFETESIFSTASELIERVQALQIESLEKEVHGWISDRFCSVPPSLMAKILSNIANDLSNNDP